MTSLKVGIGIIDYTPPVGLPLVGNYRDEYASKGIHDPLHAKSIVLQNSNGDKVALCSLDIAMLPRERVLMMRQFIASQCDIAAENILIAATHTHSGPASYNHPSFAQTDEKVIDAFTKKAASAVLSANNNLTETKLSIGYGSENRISFNRRLKCKDGQTHMNWEGLDPEFVEKPLGPTDPQIISLVLHQADKLMGALVNFGLHPAVLAGDNWLYSADYPGYLAEGMSRLVNPDFTTIFFNGCCGNVNHIDAKDKTQGRGYQMTQRIGYMLAVGVYETLKKTTDIQGDTIAVSKKKVPLKRIKISEKKKKWANEVLEKAKTNASPGQVDGLPDEFYARVALDLYETQDQDDHVEVMVIRIGDLAVVGIPGEFFCELGMDIKKQSI